MYHSFVLQLVSASYTHLISSSCLQCLSDKWFIHFTSAATLGLLLAIVATCVLPIVCQLYAHIYAV